MKIPSTFLLSFLSNLCLHLHQKLCKEPEEFTDRIAVNYNHCFRISHTSLVYGQSLHKCTGVLRSFPHSLQSVSSVHPRLSKLFAVRILLCRRIHAKKRHLASALAFQMAVILILEYLPGKLNEVSAFCGVFPICCPSPPYLVFYRLIDWDCANGLPEFNELSYFFR